VFDPLGAELGSDLPAEPQGERPDVQQALADFAASIGHAPDGSSAPRREPENESLPPPKLDRSAPQVFESKPKGFMDIGKTIVLYERCMKLIETRSYTSAHELAQERRSRCSPRTRSSSSR
jgi:hypothetical protein